MQGFTELEQILLSACRVALRQLEYDGDNKTAFHGAAFDALSKAIKAAEEQKIPESNTTWYVAPGC